MIIKYTPMIMQKMNTSSTEIDVSRRLAHVTFDISCLTSRTNWPGVGFAIAFFESDRSD
jgi:hypothetical protein